MVKIYADVMLAKLARWLRLAGIRAVNVPYEDDTRILLLVGKEKAVLLTSDEQLFLRARKQKTEVLLVPEAGIEYQLAFVSEVMGVRIRKNPAEVCPVCGSGLVKLGKNMAVKMVPLQARSHYRAFYFCKYCRKAYWHGSHWKEIGKRLAKAGRMRISKRDLTSGSLPRPRLR